MVRIQLLNICSQSYYKLCYVTTERPKRERECVCVCMSMLVCVVEAHTCPVSVFPFFKSAFLVGVMNEFAPVILTV